MLRENPGDIKSPSKPRELGVLCWNTKQQTKKNAATVSGAAFQRGEEQISEGASSD